MIRRLLSNRLAAKRSYYRRQNRQTNIKQAIDQIQGELKTARSKVAVFRQLLREAGLDPDAIMANANAAAVAVNGLPSRIPQMPQHPQHPQAAAAAAAAASAGMIPKLQGDGGNVTPPNTLAMPNQASTHMISPLLVGPRDAST